MSKLQQMKDKLTEVRLEQQRSQFLEQQEIQLGKEIAQLEREQLKKHQQKVTKEKEVLMKNLINESEIQMKCKFCKAKLVLTADYILDKTQEKIIIEGKCERCHKEVEYQENHKFSNPISYCILPKSRSLAKALLKGHPI